MTGMYLRVKRNGKWENVEVEYLTDKEIDELFLSRDSEELVRWIKAILYQLRPIAKAVDEEVEDES